MSDQYDETARQTIVMWQATGTGISGLQSLFAASLRAAAAEATERAAKVVEGEQLQGVWALRSLGAWGTENNGLVAVDCLPIARAIRAAATGAGEPT